MAQHLVLAAEAAQLLPFGGGQLAGPAVAGVDGGLVDPVAQGLSRDPEVGGELGDGLAAGAGQLDRLSAERC